MEKAKVYFCKEITPDNVIKLYNADTSSKNAAGYRTVLGATKDGSFYDLGSAIN